MSDPNPADVLLPCPIPWCSGLAEIFGEDDPYFTQSPDAHIFCKQCGLKTAVFETHAEAIAAWNTRAALQQSRKAVIQECAAAIEAQKASFASNEYAVGQPLSSFQERFACDQCVKAIRALAD